MNYVLYSAVLPLASYENQCSCKALSQWLHFFSCNYILRLHTVCGSNLTKWCFAAGSNLNNML